MSARSSRRRLTMLARSLLVLYLTLASGQEPDRARPEALAVIRVALADLNAGRSEQALERLDSALGEPELPLDDEVELRRSRIWVLSRSGRMEETLQEERVLLGLLNGLGDPASPRLLLVRLDHVLTLYELARLEEAREEGERLVLDLRRDRPDAERILIKALQNLGVVLHASGRAEQALELHMQSLALLEPTLPPDHPEVLAVLGNIASAQRSAGDRRAAMVMGERVLVGLQQSLPSGHPFLLRALHNHALDLRNAGEVEAGLELLEQVLESIETSRDVDLLVQMMRLDLANTLSLAGRREEGRAVLEGLLEELGPEAGVGHPVGARARVGLVLAALEARDLERVLVLLAPLLEDRASMELLEQSSRMLCLQAASDALLGLEREEEARALALELAAELLSWTQESVRLSTREAQRRALGIAQPLDFLLASGVLPWERVFALAEAARASGSRSWQGGENAARLAGLRSRVTAARTRMHQLVTEGGVDGSALSLEIARLALERDTAERELALAQEEGARTLALDSTAVARALAPDELAVGVHVELRPHRSPEGTSSGRERLMALVLDPAGKVESIEICSLEELEQAVEEWYVSLGLSPERGVATGVDAEAKERLRGTRLRSLVLDPLLAAAGDPPPRHLWLCAAGPLISLPMDALPDEGPAGGRNRVGDRLSVGLLPSFASLLAPPGGLEGGGLVALGGASYGGPSEDGQALAFAPLFQTRLEVEALQALWPDRERPPRLLLASEASKAALEVAAPGARFLHLATHGWADGRALAPWLRQEEGLSTGVHPRHACSWLAPWTWCGLALAGANEGADALGRLPGLLSAEEMAGWDLSACELAVLSACESGLGLREGDWFLQSLRAALHAAGARNVLSSSWRVDDAATRRLMELFYGYAWSEGLPLREALWRAKADLRREGAPLGHWAGWILSGPAR